MTLSDFTIHSGRILEPYGTLQANIWRKGLREAADADGKINVESIQKPVLKKPIPILIGIACLLPGSYMFYSSWALYPVLALFGAGLCGMATVAIFQFRVAPNSWIMNSTAIPTFAAMLSLLIWIFVGNQILDPIARVASISFVSLYLLELLAEGFFYVYAKAK